MRMIIRGFENGTYRTLESLGLKGKEITMVCTILNEERLYNKFDVITGKQVEPDLEKAYLQHHWNVFFEDIMHDWSVRGDKFYFNGHSGSKGDLHDLLIEYQ